MKYILFAAIVIAVFFGFDIGSTFLRWLGRIHMGWKDRNAWREAVEKSARKQKAWSGTIPLTDQTRFTWPERIGGRWRSERVQAWQMNALNIALEGKAREFDDSGNSPEACPAALYALLQGQYEEAAAKLAENLLAKAGEGTLPYTPALPDVRFADSLQMLCPFLFYYGERMRDLRATDLALRQLEEFNRLGTELRTGLPFHALDTRNAAPLGICGWGRGAAFWFLAFAESAVVTTGDTREALLIKAQEAAEILLRYRLPDGAWSAALLTDTRPESSATAMIGYGMWLTGALCEIPEYMQAAVQARSALMAMTRKDGTVDFAQGDTRGIGVYSNLRRELPLAQAYALRLANALVHL
ncbi:MAG: glycoside hydrolase family 88 protein [Oscillospiraceae bacterium]|jgi:unsaturated rhamnogalacturonyl hydrolase|nr:glycoside hydrolase family 88 protein [Oscillospiraceae bacterium]